jgi:hypothetical protein
MSPASPSFQRYWAAGRIDKARTLDSPLLRGRSPQFDLGYEELGRWTSQKEDPGLSGVVPRVISHCLRTPGSMKLKHLGNLDLGYGLFGALILAG